jgi:hypothetical protein
MKRSGGKRRERRDTLLNWSMLTEIVLGPQNSDKELSSSFGDSNRPLVNLCIPTYVGCVTWNQE